MAVKDSDADRLCRLVSDFLHDDKQSPDVLPDVKLRSVLQFDPVRTGVKYLALLCLAVSLIGAGGLLVKTLYYDLHPGNECLLENFVDDLPLAKEILSRKSSCSVCQNVRKIAKRRNVSPEEFERKYAYTMRPVVITDATKNWTAVDTFSFNFLKTVFQGKSLEAVAEQCQFFPYRSKFESLEEVFHMPRDRAERRHGTEPWYVGWSNCHMLAAETLRRHYGRPYFLPKRSEASKVDWIFMGSPGYGAPLHIDDVKLPSWQAQLRGRKRWTLEPPYECRLACPTNLTVTVQPGDIIVLDTNYWYHATEIVGPEMSITIGTEYD